MELVVDVVNYFLVVTMIGVSIVWISLLRTMYQSFTLTPYLDKFEKRNHETPKVSVILPARNEEGYIEKCLDSMLKQDYKNYEVIAINDSSEDNTGKIIQEYAKKDPRVIYVQARPKPEGWMGKNWACCEGYKKASGDLLLFTDSDTTHSENVISTATSHLLSLNLDAVTAIPRMLCLDFWTKITLPMISTFLHTRFSALRVNDPTKKTGYFFGSFFVIKKKTYEEIGTHEGVKQEIIEDGALGKKVKELGYKMKMVRGEHMIQAVWARDFFTLWNALKRLMIPLYLQNGLIAVGIFAAVVFLLFLPFTLIIYSALFLSYSNSFTLLFITSLIACMLIYVGGISDARELKIGFFHSALGPIGSLIVILGFMSGLINAKSNSAVSWRGRSYSMKDHVQSSINI